MKQQLQKSQKAFFNKIQIIYLKSLNKNKYTLIFYLTFTMYRNRSYYKRSHRECHCENLSDVTIKRKPFQYGAAFTQSIHQSPKEHYANLRQQSVFAIKKCIKNIINSFIKLFYGKMKPLHFIHIFCCSLTTKKNLKTEKNQTNNIVYHQMKVFL